MMKLNSRIDLKKTWGNRLFKLAPEALTDLGLSMDSSNCLTEFGFPERVSQFELLVTENKLFHLGHVEQQGGTGFSAANDYLYREVVKSLEICGELNPDGLILFGTVWGWPMCIDTHNRDQIIAFRGLNVARELVNSSVGQFLYCISLFKTFVDKMATLCHTEGELIAMIELLGKQLAATDDAAMASRRLCRILVKISRPKN